MRVDPMQRLDSIRGLRDLSRRINLGDPTALYEADAVVECSRPASNAWTFFIWFAVCLFVVVTVWFAMASKDAADDYAMNLEEREDCA
jgi:hypothetical protein